MSSLYKKLFKYHKDNIALNGEFRKALAEKNFNYITIILHVIFVICTVNIILQTIRACLHFEIDKKILFFFVLYFFITFVMLILILVIKKTGKHKASAPYNIPYYLALAAGLSSVVLRSYTYADPMFGILTLGTLCMIFAIFGNPNPFFFGVFLVVPFFMIGKQLIAVYPAIITADFAFFGIVLVVLVYYKRRVAKIRLQNEKDLLENRVHLEKMFQEQTIEIEQQAIELIHQNRKLAKMKDETILSLSNLVEQRDTDTGCHVKRTQDYVKLIATACYKKGIYPQTITEDFIELLTKAAPMHDLGKIKVPDAILKKPGKLTDEEFEQIKLHAKEGGQVVMSVLGNQEDPEYVQIAKDVATYHHEKWNGTGYPQQLKGEEIPVSARIMALADVFDALVTKRCYKAAMTYNEAFEVMQASSGSHFDPVLLDVMLENREKITKIADKYKEGN